MSGMHFGETSVMLCLDEVQGGGFQIVDLKHPVS